MNIIKISNGLLLFIVCFAEEFKIGVIIAATTRNVTGDKGLKISEWDGQFYLANVYYDAARSIVVSIF